MIYTTRSSWVTARSAGTCSLPPQRSLPKLCLNSLKQHNRSRIRYTRAKATSKPLSLQKLHLLQPLWLSTVCLISKLSQKQHGKQEGWHLSSSLVKGLLFQLINSTQVNHTVIWVENIAKLASAQRNGETSVSFCTPNYLEGKYTLLRNCYPLSLYCRHLQSYQKSLDTVL